MRERAGLLGQAEAAVSHGATLVLSSQGPWVSFIQNALGLRQSVFLCL